ncbi:MAG TPA: hypothetical protein VMG30_18395 [Acidobacteriota bacterium]|nr:hypothetical protein [Acidobacteriota bacterium]
MKYSDFAFLFGPRYALRRNEAITPFAHFLIGIDRAKVTSDATISGTTASIDAGSDKGFAFALGDGLDVKVSKRFAIRPIQMDYFYSRHWGDGMNNLSLAFGAVYRF